MRSSVITIIIVAIALFGFNSCKQKALSNISIKTQKDSLAYSMGILSGLSLREDSLYINHLIYARGIKDALNNTNLISEFEAQQFISTYSIIREAMYKEKMYKETQTKYGEHIAINKSFLEENKNKEGIITTSSGLQYKIIKMGKGIKPTIDDEITIKYTAFMIDGTIFDQSDKASIPVSHIITGVSEGLRLMPVGSEFILYVPSELGYGDTQIDDKIPPFSTLIFDIELLEINN